MNQLTPPPERDLPARRHTQIRRALTRYVTPAARAAHPFRTPLVASGAALGVAAAAVAAVVGYSALPGGDTTGSDPRMTDQHGEPPVAGGKSQTVDPVEWCRRDVEEFLWSNSEPLRVGPGLSSGDGTVQVMEASGQRWWACISSKPPQVDTLGSLAVYQHDRLGEYKLGGDIAPGGRYLSGVGRVREGVDSIRFTFPNGDVETAVIEDGFWLMTYRGSPSLPLGVEVEVEVDGRSWTIHPSSWGCSIWDEEGNTMCPELGPSSAAFGGPPELR